MKKILMAVTILSATSMSALACATCGCSDAGTAVKTTVGSGHAELDIVDTAVSAGQFQTLAAALTEAGLVETLKGKGPYTVFAPTDEAFAKLPKGTVEALLKDKPKLATILTYHVVPGKLAAADVAKSKQLKTAQGAAIVVRTSAAGVKVDGAKVVKTDIRAKNGIIHVIDRVIVPRDIVDTAASAGEFNTLATALTEAGLVDVLRGDGPFTVFAPTDEAFAALPEGTLEALLADREKLTEVLTYHVVPGKLNAADVVAKASLSSVQGAPIEVAVDGADVRVAGAQVVMADVGAGNGVIHVIDRVILPPDA